MILKWVASSQLKWIFIKLLLQAHFERKTWKGPQWKYAIWIFHKTSNQKPKYWMIYDKTEDYFNHLKRFIRKYTWRKKRFPNNSNSFAFSPKKILFCLIIELESWSFFSFVALDKLWTECFIINQRIFLIILRDLQENTLEWQKELLIILI